jgi:hypothetical protein
MMPPSSYAGLPPWQVGEPDVSETTRSIGPQTLCVDPGPVATMHTSRAPVYQKRSFLLLGDPSHNVEVWATDEHRFGLKPILCRVWAPKGQQPIALGHHRYKWLYVTAFVPPISGETFWYERGVEAVLRRAAGAVCERGRVLFTRTSI